MLTMADKGGSGGLDPPFFADIICEQPLNAAISHKQLDKSNINPSILDREVDCKIKICRWLAVGCIKW